MSDRAGTGGPAREGRLRQPHSNDSAWLASFGFLIRSPADAEALLDARHWAAEWGVPLLAALFHCSDITAGRYAEALANACGLPLARDDVVLEPFTAATGEPIGRKLVMPVTGFWRGTPAVFVCATDAEPHVVIGRIAQVRTLAARQGPQTLLLITAHTLEAAWERANAAARLKVATHGLKRGLPQFSAGRSGPQWQPLVMTVVPGLITGAMINAAGSTLAMLSVLLALPFAGTLLVRFMALAALLRRRPVAKHLVRTAARDLPVYTILVALYDESAVLPDLIAALQKLDYPPAKLDCLLVIEDADSATKAAFLPLDLPPWMRVVIVPDGEPRTKPRALNYALMLARGDYVAVYDAEDRPEPDQLRRAYAAFQTGGPHLACVQACLNIYNPRQSWLTRQFTVEYSALFDAILPALQRLRLPMPLGGTSNHFPRQVLADMYGWDPYNVTEDADLGIRIARLGLKVAMIASTTWEEAPATMGMWLRQRTRWLKGWMQTYLVHTRHPFALMGELGFFRTLGFHLYLGGLILSALVHPLFYLFLIASQFFDVPQDGFDTLLGPALWLLAAANLAVGYVAAIATGAVAVRRRGHRLTVSALLMPFYWLLISMAAYRALWQLYRDPFLWEKTPHGLAGDE